QAQFHGGIHRAIATEAERALARLGQHQHYTQLLHRLLSAEFPELPDMHQAAQHLGVTARSLRRYLAAEGKSFLEIATETLRDGALRLLNDPERSIKDVGYAMGFATPAGFHRAFKRWTGTTPSAAKHG